MKKLLLFFIPFIILNSSCTDECTVTQLYRTPVQFQLSRTQLEADVKIGEAQKLINPGKIYYKDNYLFINEIKKGIHLIDNTDPKNPKKILFISIPGVIDMAVKDNTLYADSYTDLLSFDISNIKNIKTTGRIKNMFNTGIVDGLGWYYDPFNKLITDYEYKLVTQVIKTNCNGQGGISPYYRGGFEGDVAYKSGTNGTAGINGSTGSASGTGGSMARFTVYENYLYAATQTDLIIFNIKNAAKPDSVNKVNLGWGIETIFPYKDKLFIGSNTGMHIFDNANPAKPVRLSVFQHARACDPVVVENNKAYVTLREGWCGVAPNRLDVVDVTSLTSPFILKSYNMENPHGLSILNNKLTICEGKFGLKTYDASNAMDIKLQQHIKEINAFDVIQLDDKLLLMIGKDGLYQYDNSDPKNLKILSTIPVEK
jgi:hypothetical protein